MKLLKTSWCGERRDRLSSFHCEVPHMARLSATSHYHDIGCSCVIYIFRLILEPLSIINLIVLLALFSWWLLSFMYNSFPRFFHYKDNFVIFCNFSTYILRYTPKLGLKTKFNRQYLFCYAGIRFLSLYVPWDKIYLQII